MTDQLYLWFLVLIAFAGTFIWRFLGVVIGDRIPQESRWSQWINGVAYAMVAGVMMLIVVFPSGLVATTELTWRLAALIAALGVMLWRGNMIMAVAAGLISFILASFFGI